jgi:hypothetical protein
LQLPSSDTNAVFIVLPFSRHQQRNRNRLRVLWKR